MFFVAVLPATTIGGLQQKPKSPANKDHGATEGNTDSDTFQHWKRILQRQEQDANAKKAGKPS